MEILKITKENFESEVLGSTKPVLIDFWAEWCGPCRMMSPVIDAIAEERNDILVGKINVDDEPELAHSFGIVSIPTFIVIKDGQKVGQKVGFCPKNEILAMI